MAETHVDSLVITPDMFASEVNGIVDHYIKNVKTATAEDIEVVANDVVADLKDSSPRRTGEYASGWRCNMREQGDASSIAIISNGKKPGLTHLLEHGHGGPHPAGRIPHIEPAFSRGVKELNDRLGQ